MLLNIKKKCYADPPQKNKNFYKFQLSIKLKSAAN